MKRILLCLLALLTAGLVLASCGKSEEEPEPTPTLEPTPVPTPTLPPYEPNILTGAPRDANYAVDQRPVGVMVNNITDARPQRGLSKADILVEIKVEGGITRFMPIFQNYKDIGEVGPVRSGRDQFFQLILPWQFVYIHEGQSVVMEQYARDYRDYGYDTLNINNGANGYRDFSRVNWAGKSYNHGLAYEHTMYTNSDNIQKYIDKEGLDMFRAYNSTFFNFVDYRQENPVRDLSASLDSAYSTEKLGPIVSAGEYIEITHSQSYRTRFIYDPASVQYKMQQWYSTDKRWRDTIDEAADSVQLSFTNVLVLFTDIHTYKGHEAKDLQEVIYNTGGLGYYCYGGRCETVYWQKSTPINVLQLYYLTPDGKCSDTPLDINIGKTYLSVVDLDFATNFAHLLLSEVDATSNTGSYAGKVTGQASAEREIGDEDTPTATPTATPEATAEATAEPTEVPANEATAQPTAVPDTSTPQPTDAPTATPTAEPVATATPTADDSSSPPVG